MTTAIPKKARSELIAAQRDLSEALMTLVSLQTFNTYGCSCAERGPCAYHAGLLNRITDTLRAVEVVLVELNADIAKPGRAV